VLNVGGVLEQFATPDELLRAPANEFVERFLGRDRALRRLALQRVADGPLGPVPESTEGLPTVLADVPLREALDAIVAWGSEQVVVVDESGQPTGALDLDAITSRIGNAPMRTRRP
jgi:osmoprotectant transport system ATP-binding protein